MLYACSPRLPARPSPIMRCAPGASSPACVRAHLAVASSPALRWRSTRSTSRSSPWPPAASRRSWRGRSSSAQARSASPAAHPPPTPPAAAYCECSDVVQVRRAWRWSRRSSPRSSSGCTSSAPPSAACTPCPLSRQASPPEPALPPCPMHPAPCPRRGVRRGV